MTKTNLIKLSLILITLLSQTGCLAVAAGGALGAASVIRQDRSAGELVDDVTIKAKINDKFIKTDVKNLLSKINISVSEGRVLLTGRVPERQHRMQAIELVWEVKGVKEVINEIEVDKPDGGKKLSDFFQDNYLVTRLRAKLLIDKNVKSANYSIESVNQVIYLFGLARTEEELQIVENLARETGGVKKVVNHVKVLEGGRDSMPFSFHGQSHDDENIDLKPHHRGNSTNDSPFGFNSRGSNEGDHIPFVVNYDEM